MAGYVDANLSPLDGLRGNRGLRRNHRTDRGRDRGGRAAAVDLERSLAVGPEASLPQGPRRDGIGPEGASLSIPGRNARPQLVERDIQVDPAGPTEQEFPRPRVQNRPSA
jgi:hypothetical protein